ncbi:MAG TPA: hypothetical protein VHF27_09960 [Acidimicrobiales bacterium]|nr:hypothetical protein [Acidimicrobiales bacterium]
MSEAFTVVAAFTVAALLLSAVYFRRYQITRPPIGVFNRRDIATFLVLIVLTPYLYLSAPSTLVAGLLAMATLSTLYFTLQPLVRRGGPALVAAAVLVAADVGVAVGAGLGSKSFLAVNNVVLLAVVVGVTNLWAQSGMRAADVTLMALGLSVYDVVATSHLSLMQDLLQRLSEVPLVPMFAWGVDGNGLAVGLGDMLLAAAFPLVMRKAFGRRAGSTALAVSVGGTMAMLALVQSGAVGTLPAMVALGPLMGLQYLIWHRRTPQERRTREYLAAEPFGGRLIAPNPADGGRLLADAALIQPMAEGR